MILQIEIKRSGEDAVASFDTWSEVLESASDKESLLNPNYYYYESDSLTLSFVRFALEKAKYLQEETQKREDHQKTVDQIRTLCESLGIQAPEM